METRMQKAKAVLVLLVTIIVLALLPKMGLPQNWILYLFVFFIYLTFANMWNLLAGYCGLISLCQPAFIGLGCYTLVIFTWNQLPVFAGIIGGAIVSALFVLLISKAVFRLRGVYFAIGTLVVPAALRVIFLIWRPVGNEFHGKGAGYMIKGIENFSMTNLYWMAIIIGVASIFIMRAILSSKMGMGLAATRDNDEAASSLGINIFKLKLIAFMISAFVTAIAGAVFFIYQGYISPTACFSMNWTMTMILAVVIGGIGTEIGPIIGTIIAVFLQFTLARFGGISMIIQGCLLIIIMVAAPNGIMGLVKNTKVYQSVTKYAGAPAG